MSRWPGTIAMHGYSLEERFWARVKKGPGCWEWAAGCDSKGYGIIAVDGVQVHAHRVSWRLNKGPIPKRKQVLHKCDNRKCQRPSHLFLGSNADNVADRVAKGRSAIEPNAKLAVRKVKTILTLHSQGWGKRRIGRKFGVNERTVLAIFRGTTWKHVPRSASCS